MRSSIAKSAWALSLIFFFSASTCLSQEIVLRDLTRISNVAVQDVNDEFLSLSDGQKLTWDQVLQANVDPVWQRPLDQNINNFGLALYRLKHRLRLKNFNGAYEIAKDWYQRDQQKFAGSEANFLVCRAIMLGRIDSGETELSVEPMVRALLLQQKCSSAFLNSFSGLAFSESEFKTQLCDDLVPVWSSTEQCAKQLNRLEAEFDLEALTNSWPGLAVYLSSMAVHAQQRERMRPWNSSMGSVVEFRPWQRMMNSNLSRTPLSVLIRDTEGTLRVSTMYGWATAEDQQASKSDRVLALLKIVANYREEYPALAKMSLAEAAALTDDSEEREMLQSVE
jgi:hypothetical protein